MLHCLELDQVLLFIHIFFIQFFYYENIQIWFNLLNSFFPEDIAAIKHP